MSFDAARRNAFVGVVGIPLLLATAGCFSKLTDVPNPSNVLNPSQVRSRDGAISTYTGAYSQFAASFAGWIPNKGFVSYAATSGMFADEYQTAFGVGAPIDLRDTKVDDAKGIYDGLHETRANVEQAIGALGKYAPEEKVKLAEMHALDGYLYLMFGEFFCSGVPFSRVVYDGDIEYGHPQSTQQMFEAAIAQFDSATTLAADSAPVLNLARVGKGRALLNLDRYDDAAAAVADVPTAFAYRIAYTGGVVQRYLAQFQHGTTQQAEIFVPDREGGNGLPYVTDGQTDPRVATTVIGSNHLPFPDKLLTSSGTVTLASGVEARLIQAEAALSAGDASWLDTLNALRTNGTFTTAPNADNPAVTDTTWGAGTGASQFTPALPGLAPLDDPGTDDARVDLLFKERAYWLFGTGHRQGDLRRLIRQYGRLQFQTYPFGLHSTMPAPDNVYGGQVVVEPPLVESRQNPYYDGCMSNGA